MNAAESQLIKESWKNIMKKRLLKMEPQENVKGAQGF